MYTNLLIDVRNVRNEWKKKQWLPRALAKTRVKQVVVELHN